MNSICDKCKNTFPSLTECCYGHKFCSECLMSEGHKGKFTCTICNKKICNSYNYKDNQCHQCILSKSATILKDAVDIICNSTCNACKGVFPSALNV